MTERVEAIRKSVEAWDGGAAPIFWNEDDFTSAIRDLLTALAQAERELAFYRKVGSRSAHSGCWQEYDAARAEVERLNGEGERLKMLVMNHAGSAGELRADLARVRAQLKACEERNQ